MAIYGRTWWGKKWLDTFTGIDFANRLPRGRTYANTGRAYDVQINGNIITAKVRGSKPRPYNVRIVLDQFNVTDKTAIREIISNSPAILSALINKRLPEQLLEMLQSRHIKLFPANWKDVKANCSCPDDAVPCKHIAAVIYLICAEIDKNPFKVFHIHDCDLLTLIGDFSEGKLERAQKITQIEDILKKHDSKEYAFDQSVLDGINLSPIQDLSKHVETILRTDPLFYDKNFRDILSLVYKYWQKQSHGVISSYSDFATSGAKKKDLSEEEIFSIKWHYPEQWDSFSLVVDDKHHLIEVISGTTQLFPKSEKCIIPLLKFLLEIPNAMLHQLNPELRFMHMIFQFSKKLMERSALIPQILQNKRNETFIRWIPALFDQEVRQIFSQLCSVCPPHLVQYKKISLRLEEQVKIAMAFIFAGFMDKNLPSSMDRYIDHDVFTLFFEQKTHRFEEFDNREVPAVINQWLSSLYLSERPHKLYLMVEDRDEKFELELKVSVDNKKAPISLSKALALDSATSKLTILSDVSMVTEYIPELEASIDGGRAACFALDDFGPVFLGALPALKAIGIDVILPKALQKILRPQLNLSLKTKDKIIVDRRSFLSLDTLLDFNWRVAIGDKKLSVAEFKALIRESRGIVRILDEYVLLDEKEMQALLKQLENLPERLSQYDLMQAILSGDFLDADVELDKQLTALFKQLEKYDPVGVPRNLNAELRPYQIKGFNWLVQNIETGFGSILADDMGLGKTLQVIAAILHFKNEGYLADKRVLIVVPTGLLTNWQKEIERFAPNLNLHVYHGKNRELAAHFDVLITSYGLARRDKKEFNKAKWFLLVIDEAQNIKNPNTEQTKAIKLIEAQHKVAMSGTPVENRLLEYWSLFDFTNKHYLGTSKQFKDRFALPIEAGRDKDCLDRFKKITSPFILRRLKSDKSIIKDLPEKIENNQYCSLTAEQAALYQEVVDLSIKKINESDGIERKGLVLQLLNSLKQICNHPSHFGKKKTAVIDQSGKMQILEEILTEIDTIAEKTLIFTQYVEMGEIISKLLEEKFKRAVPFLHGGLSRKSRDEVVLQFQNSPSTRILIVSLRAGGTGLNLTAANHVIHYDLWWNPAVETQATDRAYRIGQKRNVMVHRLLTTGTFEERIDEMIQSKKELANLTVNSGESWITEMSTEQLKDLIALRKTE